MKILVTGGSGFVGQRIVRALLREGHAVIAFQRKPAPEIAALGAEVRAGSLTEMDSLRSAIQECSAVIHVAAKTGVWGSTNEFYATNVVGTRVLLQVMQEAGVRRLVYCSTPSVVSSGGHIQGQDESLPYGRDWLSPYAESKALAEKEVLEWGQLGKGRVIALRPHLVFGRGDPHLLPRVIERARRGRLRIIGDGTNRVDVTRVENVAIAHLQALHALESPTAINRAYFLSQGEPVNLWGWINSLLGKLDIPPVEKSVSLRTAYQAGWVCEWVWKLMRRHTVPPMTRFVAVQLATSHWFSIDNAREQLGYQPEAHPTGEGVDRYVAAWKAGETPMGERV